MVRVCAFPNCENKMSRHTPRSFHRLPLLNAEALKLWLAVLQMDANTPVQALRLADHRVCSDHFDRDDYCQPKRRRHFIPKHFFLKKNAVPRAERPAADRAETKRASGLTCCAPSTLNQSWMLLAQMSEGRETSSSFPTLAQTRHLQTSTGSACSAQESLCQVCESESVVEKVWELLVQHETEQLTEPSFTLR